ncbi:helix-turn-helix domain-containing protein [Virgibacillus natechei]
MGLVHCNLRVLMAKHGFNIQKVKDKTTLSRTTISNLYNNNGAGIQFDTMKELCELLRCNPGDLFSYIEIEPNFDVVTPKIDYSITEDSHIVDEEGNGYDYVSEINTHLDINCNLLYEGKNHELKFTIYVQYGIDAEKNIDRIDIGLYESIHNELDKYIIPHAKEYFLDELSIFLINWGHDFFYDNEIEGITNLSVYFGHLYDEDDN